MTRLADLFASDRAGAILRILREASGKALSPGDVKAALISDGVEKAAADKGWKAVQNSHLRSHENVIHEGGRYRWTDEKRAVTTAPKPTTRSKGATEPVPVEISADQALDLLARAGGTTARRAELVNAVRLAMKGGDGSADLEWQARVDRAEGEGIRLLADLASMIEGLVDNETPPEAMVRMVRARVLRQSLEAVARAGEETTFDRTRHEPIGGSIRDGAPVFVVRPGYVWKKPEGDLLVLKVVVEE